MPLNDRSQNEVLPIYSASAFVIGTGTVIDAGLVLTALHVVDPEPVGGPHVDGIRVAATGSLPLRRYGDMRREASICYHRDRILTGEDLGTVDLAVLAVPRLVRPRLPLRHSPVHNGEKITVPGYPDGRPRIAFGAVTWHDGANFVADVTLGHGGSGAPAIDHSGHLAGLAVLKHEDAGIVFIGPELLAAFIGGTVPLLRALNLPLKPERIPDT